MKTKPPGESSTWSSSSGTVHVVPLAPDSELSDDEPALREPTQGEVDAYENAVHGWIQAPDRRVALTKAHSPEATLVSRAGAASAGRRRG